MAGAELQRTKQDFVRAKELIEKGDISKRNYDEETARLNLEFTEVRASVDGFITNLTLRIGSQGVVNQPVMALIDRASFWVHGFFREIRVSAISPGDSAVVTLMSYPDTPLTGTVNSLGWGIAQQDGSSGVDLLPSINPTFEWIRLAQRVPVRVHLDPLPEGGRAAGGHHRLGAGYDRHGPFHRAVV